MDRDTWCIQEVHSILEDWAATESPLGLKSRNPIARMMQYHHLVDRAADAEILTPEIEITQLAVAQLNTKPEHYLHRKVIRHYYLGGRCFYQIAGLLQKDERSVKMLMWAAHSKIQRWIGELETLGHIVSTGVKPPTYKKSAAG